MSEKRSARPSYSASASFSDGFSGVQGPQPTGEMDRPSLEAEDWPALVPLLLEQRELLRRLVAAQERQNALLEELVHQISAAQRQRQQELTQWKRANPQLARYCRKAAEILARVQNEFLASLTREIQEQGDALLEGEFLLTELIDRFGPRMVHLNGLLQMLSQLSSAPSPTSASPSP
ncbi:MAG: hypothetical protein NZ602_16430 [Thermoguttaceae bacterium]|nr:hypothetical protein [Thermoguttaceae bacterium]MDW8039176.1 hypothetical protein [Thermoguttaceae bacterium]